MNQTAINSSSTRRSKWGPRVLFITLGTFAAGVVAFYVTVFFGLVQGHEFSPDTFARRSFHYYEIPLVGVQVSPIYRKDETGDLESFLFDEKIVSTQNSAKPRWHLVHAYRGFVPDRSRWFAHGDAKILCRYLDSQDDKDKVVWFEWSKEHKTLAQVLWPIVAKLARQQLYVFLPDMIALARNETDPKELARQLDDALSTKYLALANTLQQLERHQAAVELYTESLHHRPGTVAALKGRAKSWTALGNREQAEIDLAAVPASNQHP